ncbi:MAG: AmmeMemoRadiSam system protein B [Dehalococcoidia bacterium]|nr:AmmeMemoRadiSam system protein B [Dehalococcoidia bacterium]
MIRQPSVAGRFYPGSARELRALIKKMVDEKAEKEDVTGYYAPHAGYPYSGPVAGAVVSRVKLTDTIVIMGPTHTGMGEPFSIMTEGSWRTPLGDVEIDSALAEKILAGSSYLKSDVAAHIEEHAIEVQLPFIQYFKPDFKLVPIVLSHATAEVYKSIGKSIARAIKQSGKPVLIVASGDMTHYEPQKTARAKDMKAVEAMLKLDAVELLSRVQKLGITMCGYAPAAVLIFAAKELGANTAELVKYQTSGDTTGDYSAVVGYAGVVFKQRRESPQVRLARETVESYTRTRKAPVLKSVIPEMSGQAGVFVSIHKGEELRGCIGTIGATQANIAGEIIQNAISAATHDPRFPPVSPDELPELNYKVDVLTEPEPVKDASQLDPKRYGAIVEAGWRRGLLLPDLEGVDSVERQLEICRAKAGIGYNEPVRLYRFEVKRYV